MKSDYIDVMKLSPMEEMDYTFGWRNANEKKKFIKRCEKYIRSSMEYRDYISFLKENIGMNACAFFNNIENGNGKRVRIEVHHAPFTLYDLVSIVINKYEAEGLPLNDLDISDEVMKIHYQNQVGLIPLSKTLHEVIHNSDKLVIPMYMIYGDYKKFWEDYGEYGEDFQYKLEDLVEVTKNLKKDSFSTLDKKFTYIEVDGYTIPAHLDTKKPNDVKVTLANPDAIENGDELVFDVEQAA